MSEDDLDEVTVNCWHMGQAASDRRSVLGIIVAAGLVAMALVWTVMQ